MPVPSQCAAFGPCLNSGIAVGTVAIHELQPFALHVLTMEYLGAREVSFRVLGPFLKLRPSREKGVAMKKTTKSMAALLILAAGLPAMAQDGLQRAPGAAAWQEDLAQRQQAEAERAERSRLILEIMSQRQELDGRAYDESWARPMEVLLEGLSQEDLERVRDLQRAGEALPASLIGDFNQDLVFTPLPTPCRVYDSRNTAEGAPRPGR